MRVLLLCVLLALASAPAEGRAVSCHCFRDRSFDPARPAAADPYVLATVQNSVMASAFGIEKRSVVQAKMTGTANEDLWLAHFVGAKSGLSAPELLDARARSGNWADALDRLGVRPERVGGELNGVLRRGSPDAVLASAVVDAAASERLGAAPEAVQALRSAGATDAETLAAVLLARVAGSEPAAFLASVRSGASTWGELFHRAGVELTAIGDEVARRIR
ncbi:MAG: hypothetical protein SCH98_05390 [Deferrisomatales bacterium]|nr:hypothetical protein [Deferrisomatales bacterium]